VPAGPRTRGAAGQPASAASAPQAGGIYAGARQRRARLPDAVREPDRSAELQGQVIKAIFAVGLHLQDTAVITVDSLVRRQIENVLSDLGNVIRLIRNTVFGLTWLSSARRREQNLAIWEAAITAHPELGPRPR
jgi:hypothetical protein